MLKSPRDYRSTFLIGAEAVLRTRKRPMKPVDIWNYGVSNGIFSDKVAGATPSQTLKSKLSVHIRQFGADSIFVRTAPGYFYLREMLGDQWSLYEAQPWLPQYTDERVVAFPSSILDNVGRFQGLIEPSAAVHEAVLCSEALRPVDRRIAELDDSHKQMLVYILVRRPGEILAYTRGSFNLTDRMLVGHDCVGFGGHVNDGDVDLFSEDLVGVRGAVARELLEELAMPAADRDRLTIGDGFSVIGYLNDDSSDVGRRHFAVVLEYWVAHPEHWDRPTRGEESITRVRWLDINNADLNAEHFEYWSQLVLRKFFPGMLRNEASFRVAKRRLLRPPHGLVVAGEVGSGKTEACGLLKREFGYSEVKTGLLMAELLGMPPIPQTPREIFQAAAGKFISDPRGVDRLADSIVAATVAAEKRSDRVLIDGVRHVATLDRLRDIDRSRKVGLLYVATPPDVAFEFYRTREAPGASIHDFLRVRDAPGEEEVTDLLARADAVINNWFGRRQYLDAIRRLMEFVGTAQMLES
jgi:predicted NUDIX family phosphoesterase